MSSGCTAAFSNDHGPGWVTEFVGMFSDPLHEEPVRTPGEHRSRTSLRERILVATLPFIVVQPAE
jgi:hypothetical protein